MNKPDFRQHYAVLDLPFDANETNLRQQYRRLAQRYHPDAQSGDTDMFVKVQQAYDALQRHLREHGHMPLAYTMPPPAAATGGIRKKQPVRRQSQGWHGKRRWLMVGAVVLAFIYVAWPREPERLQYHPDPIGAVPAPTQPATPDPTFTTGSPMSEVLDAQGVPDSGDSAVWHYGKSTVHFHEGEVVGWKEHADSPLKLRR